MTFLLGHAERVVVCNVRGRDALRNANDRIDADEMSKRLHDCSLKPVFHGAPEMLTLKELVRCYSARLSGPKPGRDSFTRKVSPPTKICADCHER
jgi:hypothetical protein